MEPKPPTTHFRKSLRCLTSVNTSPVFGPAFVYRGKRFRAPETFYKVSPSAANNLGRSRLWECIYYFSMPSCRDGYNRSLASIAVLPPSTRGTNARSTPNKARRPESRSQSAEIDPEPAADGLPNEGQPAGE